MKFNREFMSYLGLILLAVFASIMFSTSGIMIAGLKLAFSYPAQLLVRALVAVSVSYFWVKVFDKNDIHVSTFAKYKKPDIYIALVVRTLGYICFIMAIGPSGEYATLALMLLLSSKMLANIIKNYRNDHILPGKLEIFGIFAVLVGIVMFGFGSDFSFAWVALLGGVSGFLEAYRLDLVKGLKIEDKDAAQFNFWEFVGTLVLSAVMCLMALFTGNTLLIAGWTGVFSKMTALSVLLATTAFFIAKLDIYLSSKIATGTYSTILAAEIGFAGWLNNKYLPKDHEFGIFQKIGLLLSIVSIILIGISKAKDKQKEKPNT